MTRSLTLLFAIGLLAPLSGSAQTHKVSPAERVTRAVAVYEWTGPLEKPTADRLVPVSLFIGGHMEQADLYLARPVPLALQRGTVYEVDLAGLSRGLYDIDRAGKTGVFTQAVTDTSSAGWYGFGRFTPPTVTKRPVLQPSKQLSSINSTGDSTKPHFGSKSQDSSKPDASKPDAKDSDRPVLNRPADRDTGTTTTSTSGKDDDIDRPTLRKRDPAQDAQRRKEASSSGVRGPDVSLNDDPDRPTMRHGKPASAEGAGELKGLPADMHQSAAVSDPASRAEHIFAREWESNAERADTLAKLQALARPLAAKYVQTNQLVPGEPVIATATIASPALPSVVTTPPTSSDDESAPKLQRGVPKEYQSTTPAPKRGAGSKTPAAATTHTPARNVRLRATTAAKPAGAPLVLTDEQLTPYTLSYGGLPTFVYTAQANLKTGGPLYVTLVAQRMVSGDYQVSFSSLTDASHLDRTPWVRLVDAVDPDASHRASLLFELRGQTSRQFALYRLTSAQAEQTFATQPM